MSSLSMRVAVQSAERCLAAGLVKAEVIHHMGATAAMPYPAAEQVGAASFTPPQALVMQQSASRQCWLPQSHLWCTTVWYISSASLSCAEHWQSLVIHWRSPVPAVFNFKAVRACCLTL